MKKQMVFVGSKPVGYHCLSSVLRQREALNLEVIAVATRQRAEFGSADLAALASENGIPVIAGPDEIPECDFLYSVQYHQILKQRHISKARILAANLHLAPLPEYRGCNQFSFAIYEGKQVFGVTIHKMTSRIDEGDILFEDRFPLPGDIWVDELVDVSVDRGIRLFDKTLPAIIQGHYHPVPQKSLWAERGTSLHFRDEINELKIIDLNEDAAAVLRRIRATLMPGFEPPYLRVGSEKVYLSRDIPVR